MLPKLSSISETCRLEKENRLTQAVPRLSCVFLGTLLSLDINTCTQTKLKHSNILKKMVDT